MKSAPPQRRRAAGFSLVEVTLALGVTAFCLVAILGMIPVGLTSSQNAASQTGAVSVMRAVAADLRATPLASASGSAATPVSPYFSFKVPDPAGTTIYVDDGGSVTGKASARYAVLVQTVYQPTSPARNATRERVVVSWPPLAPTPTGTLESIVALDRN